MNTSVVDYIMRKFSELVASELWHLGAIKVDLKSPFTLASGNYSPIYVDCRQLISFPAFADLFVASARFICKQHSVVFDVVAGGETAGIPFAAFLARSLGVPMAYVRKEAKSHGLSSRVAGRIDPEERVLLVEDLITDAGSKIAFIQGIRGAGGIITDVLVAFDRLQGGEDALQKEGVVLHAISDIDVALRVGEESEVLAAAEAQSVRRYFADPAAWHRERNLQYRG